MDVMLTAAVMWLAVWASVAVLVLWFAIRHWGRDRRDTADTVAYRDAVDDAVGLFRDDAPHRTLTGPPDIELTRLTRRERRAWRRISTGYQRHWCNGPADPQT